MFALRVRQHTRLRPLLARLSSTSAMGPPHPTESSRFSLLPPSQKPSQTWLTRRILSGSPGWTALFNTLTYILGYSSPSQVAGRRMYHLYAHTCLLTPLHPPPISSTLLHLPPTFQSFFLLSNIHVWLLACRLRALPSRAPLQALIDHFFLDIEDRIRFVLQPPRSPTEPYTLLLPPSSSYPSPSHALPTARSAPERLVSIQMKAFRDQWQGTWVSLDYGLAAGDQHLAAALWRNILASAGKDGIIPKADGVLSKTDGGEEYDYAQIPPTLLALVTYIRRELSRLESLPDSLFLSSDLRTLCSQAGAWGPFPSFPLK